jgi:hydroxypyruvate reductase
VATKSRELLESLFQGAVAAAHPSRCLPAHLPQAPARGRLIALAAGKAAGSLAEEAERHYASLIAQGWLDGVAVTRHGYGRPTARIAMVEAGHPVPGSRLPKNRRRRARFCAAAPISARSIACVSISR